jgi:arylsulfatase
MHESRGIIYSFVLLSICATHGAAHAQTITYKLDRTVLPIGEPKRPTYKELDARNETPPPRFEVNASRQPRRVS